MWPCCLSAELPTSTLVESDDVTTEDSETVSKSVSTTDSESDARSSWHITHTEQVSRACEKLGLVFSAAVKVKVKEVYLYSAFIEVPYTQGAQVRITQC